MPWRVSRVANLPAVPDGNATTLDGHYGIGPAESEAILTEVEARYLPADASAARRRQFRAGLHLEELLLARACALGRDAAWEAFWRRYQTRLRTAARALTHEASRAEELADGLFGELFGLRTRGGERLSKLNGYMGLGSLEGWLCTLLAQAHVDRWRRERRQVSLEECAPLHTLLVPPNQQLPAAPMALRRQVATALACTLAALDAPARLLLSLHFLDGQSLAQIGALLRIHPSTVSRRLDRVLSQLRKQTRRELGRLGLRPAATDAAMHLDPRWIHLDLRQSLQVSLPAAGSGPEGARHVV